MWVTCSVQLVSLNYCLCIASCTLFDRDKRCHKLVNIYLFHKLTTWYWSTNRYTSFEMEKKNFFYSRQRTETQNSKHWRNGIPDSCTQWIEVPCFSSCASMYNKLPGKKKKEKTREDGSPIDEDHQDGKLFTCSLHFVLRHKISGAITDIRLYLILSFLFDSMETSCNQLTKKSPTWQHLIVRWRRNLWKARIPKTSTNVFVLILVTQDATIFQIEN